MAGFFGTRAVLQTDIDLILQVTVAAILVVGFLYNRTPGKVREHGIIMGAATLMQGVTFLIFMEPVFFTYLSVFLTKLNSWTLSFLIHGVTGAFTIALGLGLVISLATNASNLGPCYKRKRLMYATSALWFISVAFGVAGYIFAYILPP